MKLLKKVQKSNWKEEQGLKQTKTHQKRLRSCEMVCEGQSFGEETKPKSRRS